MADLIGTDVADCIVEYIRALEYYKGNAQAIERYLEQAGYNLHQVDDALKQIGSIAGRDCSLF